MNVDLKTLTLYAYRVEGKSNPLYCENCGGAVQAGNQWILFCPTCSVSEKNMYVTHVMSCAHCDTTLTIFFHEEKQCVYGRCHNPDCGDCFSMQDLTLLPLGKPIGGKKRISELIKLLEQLPQKEESFKEESSVKKSSPLFDFSVTPVATTCDYIPRTSHGRKTPRRPTLDQLDRQ